MHVTPLQWDGHVLSLLDQRLLPRQEKWIACRTPSEVAEAIRTMVVRGAPAIGVAAAYGMAMATDPAAAAAELKAARPTAVNLAWAVDRMLHVARASARDGRAEARHHLVSEAEAIHREDVEANMRMGRFGAALLGQSSTVLTHCNAGALATAGYGTALGVVRAAVGQHRALAVRAYDKQGMAAARAQLKSNGTLLMAVALPATAGLIAKAVTPKASE